MVVVVGLRHRQLWEIMHTWALICICAHKSHTPESHRYGHTYIYRNRRFGGEGGGKRLLNGRGVVGFAFGPVCIESGDGYIKSSKR